MLDELTLTIEAFLDKPTEARKVHRRWLDRYGMLGHGVRTLTIYDGYATAECVKYNKPQPELAGVGHDRHVVTDTVRFEISDLPPLDGFVASARA